MLLSDRVTRREEVGTASPFRLDSLGGSGPVISRPVSPEAEAKRARDLVFQEGFRAGEAAARALAEREQVRLDEIVDAHEREMGRLNDDLARAVIALAADIARHVIRTHVEVREDAVIPVVREALAMIREDVSPARLYLAPGDCALAERLIGAELEQRGCRIVPEPALGPGECRVEGPHAQVDARLATRWRKAIAPLGETRDWIG